MGLKVLAQLAGGATRNAQGEEGPYRTQRDRRRKLGSYTPTKSRGNIEHHFWTTESPEPTEGGNYRVDVGPYLDARKEKKKVKIPGLGTSIGLGGSLEEFSRGTGGEDETRGNRRRRKEKKE